MMSWFTSVNLNLTVAIALTSTLISTLTWRVVLANPRTPHVDLNLFWRLQLRCEKCSTESMNWFGQKRANYSSRMPSPIRFVRACDGPTLLIVLQVKGNQHCTKAALTEHDGWEGGWEKGGERDGPKVCGCSSWRCITSVYHLVLTSFVYFVRRWTSTCNLLGIYL